MSAAVSDTVVVVSPPQPRDGYADRMEAVDAAIRRERRPLPSHDLNGVNYRKWAAAVLAAEVKHATEDFWNVVHALGAACHFDQNDRRHDRIGEAMPFRFPHEVRASEALRALSALNLHDGDARGKWSRWGYWSRQRRREWAAERLVLKQRWWMAMARYHEARAEVDGPAETPMARAA